MVSPRLTGLEFSWFTKCQNLAFDYEQHWEMNLEPDLGTMLQGITAAARASFTGPQSMKRVAERLVLAADAIAVKGVEQDSGANERRDRLRCAEALRRISSLLISTSVDVESWKHSAATSLDADPVH